VLLDAPHQPYDNPGGPFQPTVDHLDYIELGRTTEGPHLAVLAQLLRNSYHNGVVHADRTAQRMLTSLEEAGELDRTVVVITGDHGEEFQENGFWGHTSNFSPEQVEVPFLMRGPGVEQGRESRPTSHLDLSGSLLELMGADPARRGDYSLGVSLFAPVEERARVMAGWSDLGLWTEDGIFSIPLDEGAQEIEVYDRGWNLLPDVEQRAAAQEQALRQMALECVRFLHFPNSG
jgi:membrane-anchored protein YejM (alkaline phosphatase superfamily)